MKEYFGWVQASAMAAVYVHLSGRDVDNAILRLHGKADMAEEQKEKMAPKVCSQCSVQNPATNRFCSACGMTLDREAADQMLKNHLARRQADSWLDQLMGDDEFRGLFMRKIHDLAQQRPLLPLGP
jgi:ribosomal protein L40E